jgi:hypothetical protein
MKRIKPVSPEGTMRTETVKPKLDPKTARDIQSRIGQQLREMYDDVVKQGVPDRFADLLRQLDEAGKPGTSQQPTAGREEPAADELKKGAGE